VDKREEKERKRIECGRKKLNKGIGY